MIARMSEYINDIMKCNSSYWQVFFIFLWIDKFLLFSFNFIANNYKTSLIWRFFEVMQDNFRLYQCNHLTQFKYLCESLFISRWVVSRVWWSTFIYILGGDVSETRSRLLAIEILLSLLNYHSSVFYFNYFIIFCSNIIEVPLL